MSYDRDGYERREEVAGTFHCLDCGAEVALLAETEEWQQDADGRWSHLHFGMPSAECCGHVYALDEYGELMCCRLPGEGEENGKW